MFFLHIHGTKTIVLGIHDPYPLQCPVCKELDSIDITIYGTYFHVWFIPVFPQEKDGYARCQHCDFTIRSVKFNRYTKELFQQIKKKYRFPFYTYFGVAMITSPVIIGILVTLFSRK